MNNQKNDELQLVKDRIDLIFGSDYLDIECVETMFRYLAFAIGYYVYFRSDGSVFLENFEDLAVKFLEYMRSNESKENQGMVIR